LQDIVYIYGLCHPNNRQIRYIGKSQNPQIRFNHHIHKAKSRVVENIHLARWIRKILKENKKPSLIILETCKKNNWKEREKFWIKKLSANNLCNKNEGGIEPPNNTGFKWSNLQMKNHSSRKRKGLPQWVDTPHPLLGKDHPAKGQKRSKEFCNLMREQKLKNNGMKGRKLSKKHIKRIKEKNSHPVALVNKNGDILRIFKSQKDAAITLNLDTGAISRVCKGIYSHTKGYKFADLQLSDRDWICPQCATELDRDHNSAINILAQATAGAAESNACGDSVRPTELLAQ